MPTAGSYDICRHDNWSFLSKQDCQDTLALFSSLGLHKKTVGGCNTLSIWLVWGKAIVDNCKSFIPWSRSWILLLQVRKTGSKYTANQITLCAKKQTNLSFLFFAPLGGVFCHTESTENLLTTWFRQELCNSWHFEQKPRLSSWGK